MQVGRQVRVHAGSGCLASDPNQALFTGTLAQNAGLNGAIALPEAIAAGRAASCLVRGIQITSLDNNAWEVWLWANNKFQVPGLDASAEAFRGRWVFAAGDGLRIAATGLYYYYKDLLEVYYEDDDAATVTPPPPGQLDQRWLSRTSGKAGAYLNVTLVNRSVGAKTAGGWFDLTWVVEPTLGW